MTQIESSSSTEDQDRGSNTSSPTREPVTLITDASYRYEPFEELVSIRDEQWLVPKIDSHAYPVIKQQVAKDLPRILKHLPNERGAVVIQAGGNVGIWPYALSASFDKVITFEADPLNFYCLSRNLDRLGVRSYQRGGNVRPLFYALGNQIRSVEMDHMDPNNIGAHRLSNRIPDNPHEIPVALKTVEAPLNSFLDARVSGKIDLMQFDIEGYEQQALEGAEELIKKHHPLIVLELKGLGTHYGYPDEYTVEWLENRGYYQVDRIARDSVFAYMEEIDEQDEE